MNLTIQFNEDILKKVKGLNFQADQIGSVLLVLFGLYENRADLLDVLDDFNLQRRMLLLYKEMEGRGLLEQNLEKDETHFVLSGKGIETVEFLKGQFEAIKEDVSADKIAVFGVEELKDELSAAGWIDEWLDIFPRGVRSGGRLLRGDKQSCLRKMDVFLKEYSYTKEIILEATRRYIKAKEEEGFQYTRCAIYFIYRVERSRADRISDLASWCQQVDEDKTNPKSEEDNREIMV